jgi:hypothetical protein
VAGISDPAMMSAAQARYDATVTALAQELARLPGIVGAVPTRSIPFHAVGGTYELDDHYNREVSRSAATSRAPPSGWTTPPKTTSASSGSRCSRAAPSPPTTNWARSRSRS